MPNKDGSETEQEYYQRVNSVPGIFSDRNEGAEAVINRTSNNVASAEDLEKKTALAPAVNPDQDRPEVEENHDSLAHVEATQVPGYQPQVSGEGVAGVEDPEDAHKVQTGTFPAPQESSTNAQFPVANEDGTLETFQTNEKGETESKTVAPEDNPAISEEEQENLEDSQDEEPKDAANQNEEKTEDPQFKDEEQTQDPAESKADAKAEEIEEKEAEDEKDSNE